MQFMSNKVKTFVLSESESRYFWNMVICCCNGRKLKRNESLGHISVGV